MSPKDPQTNSRLTIRRLRRVAAHPFANDPVIIEYAQTQPQEVYPVSVFLIESICARIRPLLISSDFRVTDALAALAQTTLRDDLCRAWEALLNSLVKNENERVGIGPQASVHQAFDGGDDFERSWQWVARDFIYGDLVHADAEGSAGLNMRARYNAALQLAAQVVMLNNLTLEALSRGLGRMASDDPVWSEEVDLRESRPRPWVPDPFPWHYYRKSRLTVSVTLRRSIE